MIGRVKKHGDTSYQQRGHTETAPRFKVSYENPEKRGGGGGGSDLRS